MKTIEDPEMLGRDLSPLFSGTYRSQRLFPHTHPGQASWVWSVDTTEGERIVRTSRFSIPPDEDFWQGAKRLFDVDSSQVRRMVTVHRRLEPLSSIPLPKIFDVKTLGENTYLILEKLPGYALSSFMELPAPALTKLGEALGSIHSCRYSSFGSPLLMEKITPPFVDNHALFRFHARMVETMQYLVDTFYADDLQLRPYWTNFLDQSSHLLPLDYASPIMLDMDPTQFLADGAAITGLVDTELYALGPRQLELIGLEYLLDEDRAQMFRLGYERIMPLPILAPYRSAYRLLLRLMSFQGTVDWTTWMNAPIRFIDHPPSPVSQTEERVGTV
ncbi:MAG: aminoglycoside phosphotransferase family protein [Sulfobacillus sp.]